MSDKMQIILSTFFKSDEEGSRLVEPWGEWTVKIGLAEANPELKHTILTRRFLVLPAFTDTPGSLDGYLGDIGKFWELEVVCLRSVQSIRAQSTFLFDKLFSTCERSPWSSFYPDPKSDVTRTLFVDAENRIPLV